MDEKRHIMPTGISTQRLVRPLLTIALFALAIYTLHQLQPFSSLATSRWRDGSARPPPPAAQKTERKVPLEAHIMSKCPDAKDCLRDMILPAMQRVHDKVDFTLSFIGRPIADDQVECKHGSKECLGNIIELCVATLYPDPKTYLGFTMCLTRQYKDIPERSLVEDCALEHAVDMKALNDCATKDDGGYGMGLLRDSVTRTSLAGVTKSCTVRLDQEIYCIRDDGEWKDCPNGPAVDDLVTEIEKRYHQSS